MTPSELVAFRQRLKLSQKALALALGVGRRTLGLYESGARPVPKTVALACAALAYGLPPME